ncbi:DUF2325 domain-containing protein, partial [Piscibacillus sp. B03]|uniref:DUF2325 domain-containing protein n=1 Tax=Piscibacillus sp. B03 TaxID=3457430 RepID=UPI003FCD4258
HIKLNDAPYTFLLSREDVIEHQLKEGDIVDLAYYQSQPSTVRVIWKHDTKREAYQPPMKSGYYKQDTKKKEDTTQHNLEDKRVLVLGSQPRKAEFKEAIESAGGQFDWIEGTEGEERIERKVVNSDVVIILIKYIRHHASQFTVKMCKEHGVDYSIVDTFGIQTVVHAAAEPQVKPA